MGQHQIQRYGGFSVETYAVHQNRKSKFSAAKADYTSQAADRDAPAGTLSGKTDRIGRATRYFVDFVVAIRFSFSSNVASLRRIQARGRFR
jgi:hypothetical protein